MYLFHSNLHAQLFYDQQHQMHGGWNETDTFGDIWIFNTDSFTWMQPRTSGILKCTLKDRTDGLFSVLNFIFVYCTCSFIDIIYCIHITDIIFLYFYHIYILRTITIISFLFIFSYLYFSYHYRYFYYIFILYSGFTPTPRYGHTITLTPDGRLLVFGGCSITKDAVGLPK